MYRAFPTSSAMIYQQYYSNFCSGLQKNHLFCDWAECVLAVQGRSGSSKVDYFGTNRKRVCDFLVINSNYGPILRRFWDTATYRLKIAYFSYPSLIWCPRSLCSLWNFAPKLTMRKLESRGYPPGSSEDRMESFWHSASVWQTDRQTDRFTIANTALCIASYADAL